MAMAAAMVIVFPTRCGVWSEAEQQVRAILYGSALAVVVLAVFVLSQHLLILFGIMFLYVSVEALFQQQMLTGPQPGMVYQYGYSVLLSLVAGALSTQDAGYATFTRVVLTMAGSGAAAYTIALLDQITDWRGGDAPHPAKAPDAL